MNSNETTFATAYLRASNDLMESIASASPTVWLSTAERNAQRAWLAAANTIEESLAGALIDAITAARPLVMA